MGEQTNKRPVIIAISNQKGGVGKTTTSINLASSLVSQGKSVLVVDLDPQANTTSGLGVDKSAIVAGTYHILFDPSYAAKAVIRTPHGIAVMPAVPELAAAEVELVGLERREHRLAELLPKFAFDYILIDSPPSLGLLTLNALTAADHVIIPVQAEYYALEGLGNLLGTMQRVKAQLNKDLNLLGILMTMYDSRTTLSDQVVGEVHKHFPGKVFETMIPRNIRLAEVPSYGKPIQAHDKWSKGAKAYKKFAREMNKRVDSLSAKDATIR